jgi:sensor histidine kinase YesM
MNTIEASSAPSRAEQLLRGRFGRTALIWVVWTIIALFFTTQVYMMYYSENRSIPYAKAFFVQAAACYLWALATPFVLWMARTFRIERSNWRSRLAIHFGVSLALNILLLTTHFLIFMLIVGRGSSISFLGTVAYVLYNLDRWMLVYWTILLISHALNYYHSYRQGQLQASQLRTQLVQAQLEALKMQVHPHFLFNTLHSISALLTKDTEAARKMITRLGDFLRLTLENGGSSEVSLRQEMEFLNSYLEIERIRFQDRLTTEIHVDPQVLDVQVPNLILQPIVENAMRHAIANSNNGRIEITATPRNGMLQIQVKDNGPGLNVESKVFTRTGKGVGLANTRARLQHLYGPSHKFELTNSSAGGLVVTFEIPRH